MRLIDADALKRKEQKIATETWKMKVKASVESILNQFIDHIDHAPTVNAEPVVRCWECFYRRRCMLQHFVESNAVDGAKIDWSKWYCADGVRDINVPNKSDERLEE